MAATASDLIGTGGIVRKACRYQRTAAVLRAACVCFVLAALVLAVDPGHARGAQRFHFAANGNFDVHGAFTPVSAGFNIADVGAPGELDSLPDNVKGMVWIGTCDGANAAFKTAVQAVVSHPKLFGIYLMDDPDPVGRWHHICAPANLRAEADWIHRLRPDCIVFVALMNLSSSATPSFDSTYTPETTHADVFSIAPYPCRTEWPECDYDMIDRYVAAAAAAGIPVADLVPTYQTFSLGDWHTDSGGWYRMPNDQEMTLMLQHWRRLVPAPVFDFAYSWGSQRSSSGLASSAKLQSVFRVHNAAD